MSAHGAAAPAGAALQERSAAGAVLDTAPLLTLADIEAAAARLDGHIAHTPFLESRTLSAILGAQVFLKFENLQFTASFKERGALNVLSVLKERDALGRGVIAASAGNHAQGVAHHAQRLGVPAVIVMPRHTPAVKVARTQGFGAEVRLHGDNFDEARAHALEAADAEGLVFVHPFDDPLIAAGQGTLGLEMLRERPDLEVLSIAVGGGGLIGGVATAAKALKPSLQVIGVQSARFPGMANACTGSSFPKGASTIAEGIAVGQPGRYTQRLARAVVDDWVLVEEGDIEQAVLMLLEIEKTVVEGAGAAGMAALLRAPERFAGKKVGLVLCGGNIDPLLLAALIGRGMVRSGRLARIAVGVRDVPGALAQITARVAEAGANIDEVHHQRLFAPLAAQNAEVQLVLQTRNAEHVAQVVRHLEAGGFQARVL